MRKLFEFGGLVAAVVLIAFGGTAIVMGVHGGNTVKDSLKLEQITGTPDMTPGCDQGRGGEGRPGRQRDLVPDEVRRRASRSTPVIGPARSPATCGSTRSRRRAASRTP